MSTWTDTRDAVEYFFTHKIWILLKPFLLSLKDGAEPILIGAAEDAVKVGYSSPGDGQAKMNAALAAFSSAIMAAGIPFIESQARTLIELALQKAKKEA